MTDQALHGKIVVITGASSGFGKGAARAFAEAGANVVLAARRSRLLDALARECEAKGVRALVCPTDVSRREDVERLAQCAVDAFGRIDVWINNAGVGVLGRFEEVPLADHVRAIETNLLGVMYGCYVALKHFRRRKQGTVINVAAALGKVAAPYNGSYTAAKFGVVGLGTSLRQELAANGRADIHVCTVMPMAHDTPWFDHAANYSGHEVQPVPPLNDPQDVIDTIVRLAVAPEDEVIVGASGKAMLLAHSVAPALTERVLAGRTHRVQMEELAHAPATRGSVAEPRAEGTGVYGGRLSAARATPPSSSGRRPQGKAPRAA